MHRGLANVGITLLRSMKFYFAKKKKCVGSPKEVSLEVYWSDYTWQMLFVNQLYDMMTEY